MTDPVLSGEEAETLIRMEKIRATEDRHKFPNPGQRLSIDLQSGDGREQFILDVGRGRIDLQKVTYQNRAKIVVVLLRLDVSGPPHRNPDDQEVPCPHLHIYREGYGDRWAYSVSYEDISDPTDKAKVLEWFYRRCNVIKPPMIDIGLF